MAAPNPFLLAADSPARLLTLLREQPELAAGQDEHGYSLVHAAASYNHLDLLRALVSEFRVNVDLKDEDGETALFVVETTACAKVLVEELHADVNIRGDEGVTARERIESEGDYPEVAVYLLSREGGTAAGLSTSTAPINGSHPPKPVPDGLQVNMGTMDPTEVGEGVVDPELRRMIEELAARPDFHDESGQQALRDLVTQALHSEVTDARGVRQRTE